MQIWHYLEYIRDFANTQDFARASSLAGRLVSALEELQRPPPRPDKGATDPPQFHPDHEKARRVSAKVPELQRALQDKNAGRVAYIVEQCLSAWEGKSEPEH